MARPVGRKRAALGDRLRRLTARLGTDRRLPVVLVLGAFLVSGTAILPPIVARTPDAGVFDPYIASIHGPAFDLVAPPDSTDTAAPTGQPAPGAAADAQADAEADVFTGPYGQDGTLLALQAPALTPQPLAVTRYTVRPGDTLTGIAASFHLSMMSIWWSNSLASKDQLHVGQVLVIPPIDGVVYTAAAGDMVPAVAARYHADPDAIRSYNALTTDELTLGQQVMIPNGVGPAIAVVATPVASRSAGRSTTSRAGSAPSGGRSVAGFAPLLWPVRGGYISQGYGCTGFPYEPPYGNCAHFHTGIDIAAPVGTAVNAAASGTVTYAGWRNNDGGYQVEVKDAGGFYTGYYHLSAVLAHVGEHLTRGQLLGRVGSTGHSTGPHLLFSVWVGPIWYGGYPVNPLDYF